MPCYFLYGEDTFSSKRKLDEIKSRFFDANLGDANINPLEGENLSFNEIQKAISQTPFLAPKRLVIVKNFLERGKKEVQEKIAGIIDRVPDFTILIFYEEGNFDKSLSLFKKLNTPKRVQKFPLLHLSALIKWISKEVRERGGEIELPAAAKLAQITGSDLWRVSQEINKLISYQNGRLIKKEDVELLTKEEIHPNVFSLVDALGERKTKEALSLLSELLASGENENYLLSMITYQFRNLIIVKNLQEKQKPFSLAGLHPFVLEKTRRQASNFSQNQLIKVYDKLLKTDLKIKTGALKPALALNLLVSEISQ